MNKLTNALARIHQEEDGMEALQVVLILTVAAIVLAFVYKIFGGASANDTETTKGTNTIAGWIGERIDNMFNWK